MFHPVAFLHGKNLRIKGRSALVPDTGVAQIHILPMIIIEHTDFGRVGIITARARGKEIFLPVSLKESRRFACHRREQAVIVSTVFPRYAGIIIRERRADQLEMRPFKKTYAFPESLSAWRVKSPESIF